MPMAQVFRRISSGLARARQHLSGLSRPGDEDDLDASRGITYAQWKDWPAFERAQESLGWLLERQQ